MRHEPGRHIVPLAGGIHGGGWRVPRPMAEGDICHGEGSLPEVAGPGSKQPSDADCQGKLLLYGEPVDPHAQVLGRRLFRVVTRVAGVAFQACVVQMPPPPGQGSPPWWAGRLASGVGARFHARPASWGTALVRGLVCCSARGRGPVTRGGSMLSVPQGDVVALEVCLARHCEGPFLCMVASWLWAHARARRRWDRVKVTHAGLHEGIERVFVAVVSAGQRYPAGRVLGRVGCGFPGL